jgi:hypothetical protein
MKNIITNKRSTCGCYIKITNNKGYKAMINLETENKVVIGKMMLKILDLKPDSTNFILSRFKDSIVENMDRPDTHFFHGILGEINDFVRGVHLHTKYIKTLSATYDVMDFNTGNVEEKKRHFYSYIFTLKINSVTIPKLYFSKYNITIEDDFKELERLKNG